MSGPLAGLQATQHRPAWPPSHAKASGAAGLHTGPWAAQRARVSARRRQPWRTIGCTSSVGHHSRSSGSHAAGCVWCVSVGLAGRPLGITKPSGTRGGNTGPTSSCTSCRWSATLWMTWHPLHCAKMVPAAQARGFTGRVVVVPHLRAVPNLWAAGSRQALAAGAVLLCRHEPQQRWRQACAGSQAHRWQVNCSLRVRLGLLDRACSGSGAPLAVGCGMMPSEVDGSVQSPGSSLTGCASQKSASSSSRQSSSQTAVGTPLLSAALTEASQLALPGWPCTGRAGMAEAAGPPAKACEDTQPRLHGSTHLCGPWSGPPAPSAAG